MKYQALALALMAVLLSSCGATDFLESRPGGPSAAPATVTATLTETIAAEDGHHGALDAGADHRGDPGCRPRVSVDDGARR